MTLRLVLLAFCLFAKVAANPQPELFARNAAGMPAPLKISKFEVEVTVFEDLAETAITITFDNPTRQNLEGEFALPLPPGVTVSGYQLEVEGEMRDSTVVDRERARFAYESIKRRNIDPGYVERQPGNVYRTRIFPILPGQSKAVRLIFCQSLEAGKDHLTYRLPVPPVRVERAIYQVTPPPEKPHAIASPKILVPAGWTGGPGLRVTIRPRKLEPLVIHVKKPTEDEAFQMHPYQYERTIAEPSPLLPPECAEIDLVWDSSESGRQRDHDKEFAFLDDLFQKHPDLTVHLTRLRLTPSPAERFEVKKGNWEQLREALENTFYDGGTDLAALRPGDRPTFLFTDGHSTWAKPENPWPSSLTLVDSTGRAATSWTTWVREHQGRCLDLSGEAPFSQSRFIRRFTKIKTPKEPGDQEPIYPQPFATLEQLWAAQELRRLEAQFVPDAKAITAHCKKHHLVSDSTSLIVLERFEDHVRYRIPPPDPEWLAKYEKAIRRRAAPSGPRKVLADNLEIRREWHTRDFPWEKHLLEPALARLAIWQNSLGKAFAPAELNPDALQSFEKTLETVRQLREQQVEAPFDSLEEHDLWRQKVKAVSKRLIALDDLALGKANEGRMAIAVNGFVQSPGKITVPTETTLQAALAKAGGPTGFGAASRVALYRNGQKTIFNLLSKESNAIPLQPADLIVVERARLPEEERFRPSFAPDPKPIDYRKEPPVIPPSAAPRYGTEVDAPFGDDPFAAGPFGGDPFSFSGGQPPSAPDDAPGSAFNIPRTQNPDGLDLREVSRRLKDGADPVELYRQLRPRDRYPDDFYLQFGDLFLAAQKPKLARRVLSNLVETPAPRPSAYRKWAYVLARHSDWSGARDLLARAARLAPRDLTIVLDQAWLSARQGNPEAARKHLRHVIETFDPQDRDSRRLAELAAVTLSEFENPERLPLDLRLVVSSASGQSLDLRLAEPLGGFAKFGESFDLTNSGGRSFQSIGVAQYSLRQALPGQYDLSYRSATPQIVRVRIERDWGRPSQTSRDVILFLPATRTRRLLSSFRIESE